MRIINILFIEGEHWCKTIIKGKNSAVLKSRIRITVRSHLGLGNFPRPREIAIFNPREIP